MTPSTTTLQAMLISDVQAHSLVNAVENFNLVNLGDVYRIPLTTVLYYCSNCSMIHFPVLEDDDDDGSSSSETKDRSKSISVNDHVPVLPDKRDQSSSSSVKQYKILAPEDIQSVRYRAEMTHYVPNCSGDLKQW